jgi:hypothetical protein
MQAASSGLVRSRFANVLRRVRPGERGLAIRKGGENLSGSRSGYAGGGKRALLRAGSQFPFPWQCLNFLPLPHGQGWLRLALENFA